MRWGPVFRGVWGRSRAHARRSGWVGVSGLLVAVLLQSALVGPARADDTTLIVEADSATVIRGLAVEVDVLANDSGPGGAALVDPALELVTPPTSGSAEVVDPDGPGGAVPFVRYTPALNTPAAVWLDYQVTDVGLVGTARVSITVGNASPRAGDDRGEVRSAAGATVLIAVLANDTDVDGGVLSVLSASRPAHGVAAVESGQLRYDPVDDFVGADTFTYTISDGQGGQSSAAVVVTVLDATTAMTLRPDTVVATSGVVVSVPVLSNDVSGGRDPLTVVGVSRPKSGGNVAIAQAGRGVLYTAPASFVGADSFTYSVRDRRGNVATGQVTATVSAPAVTPAVSVSWPSSMVVGVRYRVPVRVAGFDATGRRAELQHASGKGWSTVAKGTLARTGGQLTVQATTGLAGLRPGRNNARARLRVLVHAPADRLVGSTAESVAVRALVGIAVSGPLARKDVRYSYRPGCPVKPSSLRRMSINYWDYSGALKRGTLIVRADAVRDLEYVFTRSFNAGFQIKKMRPTDYYYKKGRRSPTASDKAAMSAGNTSAFNCRPVVGNPTKRSAHSYGVAIDINTFQNPYVVGGGYYPRGAGKYLKRSPCRTGMICTGGAVATAMRVRGWPWGARWSRPDYQHFSANGG